MGPPGTAWDPPPPNWLYWLSRTHPLPTACTGSTGWLLAGFWLDWLDWLGPTTSSTGWISPFLVLGPFIG